MSNHKTKTTTSGKPFCIRLSDIERSTLENAANGIHLSKYIKSVLFDRELPQVKRRNTTPVKDHQKLAKLLAELGKSRIASNLNQLAKAANSGSLPVTPDVLKALNDAAQAILSMRFMLMQALGLKRETNSNPAKGENHDSN